MSSTSSSSGFLIRYIVDIVSATDIGPPVCKPSDDACISIAFCLTRMKAYIQRLRDLRRHMGDQPLKILGLAGEYRSSSKSGMLVNAALGMAEAKGAEVVFGTRLKSLFHSLVKRDAGLIRMSKNSKASSRRAMPFSSHLPNTTARCLES